MRHQQTKRIHANEELLRPWWNQVLFHWLVAPAVFVVVVLKNSIELAVFALLWMPFIPRFSLFPFSLPKRSQKKSAEYQDRRKSHGNNGFSKSSVEY